MLISHTALSHSRATASLHKTTTQSLSLHQSRHTIQTHSSPPLPTHSDIQIAARFFRVSGGSDPIGGVVGYRPSTSPAEDATPTDFNPPTSPSTIFHHPSRGLKGQTPLIQFIDTVIGTNALIRITVPTCKLHRHASSQDLTFFNAMNDLTFSRARFRLAERDIARSMSQWLSTKSDSTGLYPIPIF